MDQTYGEGNYWYRGQAPGTWTDWESFHYGGGGSYGTRVLTANDINSLWNSEYGGFWSSSTGNVFYKNKDQAYFATCDYIDSYGYWGNTEPKSYANAESAYILLQSQGYYTASLDGGPAKTYSLSDNAPKQDFSGFWGGLKYFFTGGYVGGYSYNIKGEVTGLAPITGMAPTPGIKGTSLRSAYQKSIYLRELAESGKLPKWMNQWLKNGKVPPGYQVDHKLPLSVGGKDIPSNMRLNQTLNHWMHHIFYHPWRP